MRTISASYAGLMWLAKVARSQFHFHQATASQVGTLILSSVL